jgi:hypothetical protein
LTLSQKVQQLILQQIAEGKHYRDISKNLGVSIGVITNMKRKGQGQGQRTRSSINSVSVPTVITPKAKVVAPVTNPEPKLEESAAVLYETGPITDSNTSILNETGLVSNIEVDFSDTPYPESYPNPNIEAVNITSTVVKPQEDAEKEEGGKNNQLKQSATLSITTDSESVIDIGMDWDDPTLWERRLFRAIMNDRGKRREELQRIEQVADLLPLARQLKNSGITVEMLLSYTSLVNEKAAVENIDTRTAAIYLARDLGDYKQTILDLKAEGMGLEDLTKLVQRKMNDDYSSFIWGGNY